MSATWAIKVTDGVILFSDRAVYDNQYVVRAFKTKIATAERVPLAIATRGSDRWSEHVASTIIDWADDAGVDEAIATFAEATSSADQSLFGFNPDLHNELEVVIGCVSPTLGPQLLVWHNRAHMKIGAGGASEGYAAVGVIEDVGPQFIGAAGNGTPLPPVRKQAPGEHVVSYAACLGKTLMEHWRSQLLPPGEWDAAGTTAKYIVGGGVDMTIVNGNGCEVRRIVDWPDRIGEPINPFSTDGSVVPLLSRQQRRAAERQAKKA